MKVLLINGSTRRNGCVYTALGEIAGVLNKEGVETEILQMSSRPVYDCKACGYCENGAMQCAVKDDYVNEWIKKAAAADGFVVGSPVYYAHPTGQLLSVPDRMFYAAMDAFRYKPAASIVTARRAGTTASLDVINKFFLDACMPIVSSTYRNMAHGNSPEQIKKDEEGLQTMRNIGLNMAWLLKCINAGKQAGIGVSSPEMSVWTNFIR